MCYSNHYYEQMFSDLLAIISFSARISECECRDEVCRRVKAITQVSISSESERERQKGIQNERAREREREKMSE
jgi:hypothetical protein